MHRPSQALILPYHGIGGDTGFYLCFNREICSMFPRADAEQLASM